MRRAENTDLVFRLKVTLLDVRPPIWRRILVPAETNLHQFHQHIQTAMGWQNAHLYQFEHPDGSRFTEFFEDDFVEDGVRAAREVTLGGLGLGPKDSLLYEYDFGDGWMHEILVERLEPRERELEVPRCIAGRRACPPEDCGGPHGYAHLLEVLAQPRHRERRELLAWLGGAWDAEKFDLGEADALLRTTHRGKLRIVK